MIKKAPRASLHLGFTKNMGNYESLKIDVGFERDINEGETVEGAYEKLTDLVLLQLKNRLGQVQRALTQQDRPPRRV
jgi:hypothetical protein